MTRNAAAWIAAELADPSVVFWRGVAIVAGLAAVLLVGAVIRRRWAPRSLENWPGEGVPPQLDPITAGILLRVHPTRLLVVALEPVLRVGAARIESVEPLRLEWPDRAGKTPLEAAAAAVFDEEGHQREDGFFGFLEAAQREAETKLEPFSGRAAALLARRRVATAHARADRGAAIADGDRPWLLLRTTRSEMPRIPPGPTAEIRHDLMRLAAIFRLQGPDARAIADRAHGAASGYFRHRRDLDLVRTRRGLRVERERAAVLPESPVEEKLRRLSESLDGVVRPVEPGRPFLLHYARVRPRVTGRHRGRAAAVELGPDGEVRLELASSAGLLYRLEPTKEGEFRHEPVEGAGFGDGLSSPRIRELLGELRPFRELEGRATQLFLRLECDRESFDPSDILDRFGLLISLAECIEQRLLTAGARGPRGSRP